MKLHLGAVPEDPEFDPLAGGWAGIREPGPCLIQILALPIAFAVVAILIGLFYLVWPAQPVTISPPLIITFIVILLPAHELLHAVLYPAGLRSPLTVIGFWPSRFVFYAHYDGELTRRRFLIVLMAPFVVLSLVPIVIVALFQWPSLELLLLAVINGGAASGDIIGVLLVTLQIPRSAIIRNHGWRSYWRYHG